MSVRENTPTFKYVAVENLVITYNQKPYPIKNMYTNKKYIIWNIDRPNQLEDSNVRPEESLLEYLIVINDNGIPTILSHDNLTLSFDSATNGFSSNGDFDSIKDQVNENTKKYNILIKDVNGITNVIGKTEELKDGSIIYNLNKIKADSESFGVQLEEVKTQVDDKFKDLKPVILNNLIDYSISVSEYKLSLTSLKNDIEVTEEELSKINTNKTNMSNSLTKVLTSLDSLKSILDSVNDETKSQLITDAKNQLILLNNSLTSACDTALLDNKLSDFEKTTITQKAYELSQYIGVVQNTCNNITVGGSDGVIYKVQNEFLLYKDRTENNITELSREGDLLNSKLSSYKQTMDEIDLSVKKVTSQYNEDKEMVKIKETIISLTIEENTLLGELSSIIKNAFEDDTISIEEKTNIQSKRDLIVLKKDLLLTEINKVLAKLLESNNTVNHANLTNKKDVFSASLTNMINKLNSIINKSNVTSDDTNTLVDLITTSKTKLTDLKNTCDEIISLGFGGAIYEQLSDFQIKSDGIISTVKEITQDAKGNIKSSVIKYYASTSQTELVGGKWEDTIPLDANKFIWIKIVTTYGDGTIKEGTPTCISSKGLNGADGVPGQDGVSVEEVVIEYAKNQYTTTAPTTGWSTSMPSYQKGYYLWYRTRIKYSNSSYYVYSTPVCDQSWKASQEVYTQYEQLKDKFTWIVSSGTSQSNMVLSEKLYELTTQRAIISAKKIELNGSININGGTFKVDTSGNMTCNSGTFKGAIIGGTIDINNGIFKVASNGNTKIGGLCTHTNSDGTSRGIFEVTSEGTVYSRHKTNQNIYTMLTEGKITVKNNEGTLTFTNGQMKISDGSTATYYGDGYIGHNNSIMVETPRLNCTQIVTATKFTSGTNAILKSELNSSTNGSGGSIYLCCNGGDYNDTDSRVIRYFKNSDGNYVFRPNSQQGVMYLGTATYPFGNVMSKKLTQTSDRTLKKNITYLSNSISTYNLNNDISIEDCYNFVSNDLPIATYNYIDDNDKKIGFIAQDLLYNKDETDNKIGQLIVNPKGYTEENGKLTYDLGNYVSVLAGALQVAIRKIDDLEKRLGSK